MAKAGLKVCAEDAMSGRAVAELRASGRQVDDDLLALISPAHNENVGFYGTFSFDVDRELAALAEGYRPLRQARR